VGALSRRHRAVLDLLSSGCAMRECERTGTSSRDIGWGERVRDDDISEDAGAGEYDLQVGSASILGAEALRFFAGSCTGVICVAVEGMDDAVVAEVELLALVAIAAEVMPRVELNGVLRSTRGAVGREESAIGTKPKVETRTDNIVSGRQCVCEK
jgi:hypothetical protein